MKLRKITNESIEAQYKKALEDEHTILEPTEANALVAEKDRKEEMKDDFKESEKAAEEVVKATAPEERSKVKDRAELSRLISEAKQNNQKFRISRCIEEGYRYLFEILEDETDKQPLTESEECKGEECKEEKSEEKQEEVKEENLKESLAKDNVTIGDLVVFLRDLADDFENRYDSETKVEKVSNTYFLGHPYYFLGIAGSRGGYINLDNPAHEEDEDMDESLNKEKDKAAEEEAKETESNQALEEQKLEEKSNYDKIMDVLKSFDTEATEESLDIDDEEIESKHEEDEDDFDDEFESVTYKSSEGDPIADDEFDW